MRKIFKAKWSFFQIKNTIMKRYQDHNSVLDDAALINNLRINYLSIVTILMHIIILLNLVDTYETERLRLWSKGVITSHIILIIFMVGFFLITLRFKHNKKPNKIMGLLPYITFIVIMATGISITTFDQLITANINPFMIACVVCGTVLLIRPLISLIIYAISYVAYFNLIGLAIVDESTILTNRINGFSISGVGFLLSVILWTNFYTIITQKKHLKKKQKQLEQQAYTDSLTGLPNRRMFDKFLKSEISLLQRYNGNSVIIMLDIDDFKNINDEYGHPVGDKVLIELSNLLKDNIRAYDTVARFGGEEFIILMPKASLKDGYEFAKRLKKLIAQNTIREERIIIQITCSFGIVEMDSSNTSSKELYIAVDKALYLAKKNGKNRVEKVLNK